MCSALRGSEQKAREGRSSPAAAGELGAAHLLGGADGWTCTRVEGARRASGGAALPSQRVRSLGCERAALRGSRWHTSSVRRCSAPPQPPVRVEAASQQKVKGRFDSTHPSSGPAAATRSASWVVGVGMMPAHGSHGLMGHASTRTDGSLRTSRSQDGLHVSGGQAAAHPLLLVRRASAGRLRRRRRSSGPSAHVGASGRRQPRRARVLRA